VVSGYVGLSHRRPWLPLLIIGLITAVSFRLSGKLRIDTDLRVLLPKGTPSVQALEASEQRLGSTDLFTIAFESPDIEAVGRFQEAIADSVRRWEEVVWVQHDQDRAFFEDRALLYLPADQLEDLRARISGMIGEDFAEANPLIADLGLEDEPEEKPSLEGWPDPEALRRQGLPQDMVEALLAKVRNGGSESAPAAVGAAEPATGEADEPPRPDSLKHRLMGWHGAKGVWVGVILAQLNRPSTDAIFAKGIYDKGEALIARMDPPSYGDSLVAKVAGAYRNFSEIKQVNYDMVTAGIISLGLVVSLLLLFVRKAVNLLLLNIPLLVAMSWTTGITYLIFERLTLLTAFILALILGLGIEYAVHVYSRWAEENRAGRDPVEAMAVSVHATARALLAGAATNVFAMLSLQVGTFQGFKEFGVVVSIGITCALLCTWLVMPPLFFLFTRLSGWLRKRFEGAPAAAFLVAWLLPGESKVKGGMLLPAMPYGAKSLKVLAGLGLLFSVLLVLAPKVEFENDFKNLRGKSTSAGISYGRAVGGGRNTSPSLILGTSEAQMRSVHDSLVARYGNPADSMLKSYATIQSFVPSDEAQAERKAILERIRTMLDARALERVDSATKADLDLLRKYVSPDTFGFRDIPDWAQRFLTEADGTHGRFGYLYGSLRESDAIESAKFQDRFGTLPSSTGPVPVASSGFIYADVVRMVKRDGVWLGLVTLLFLIVITAIDMRSWRGVLITVGFIALSAWWTYGFMGLLGLRLGMFNLVVLPTILSVSVDSVIHLYHRRMELGRGHIGRLYRTTGSAVLAGTLNNAFGFAGLCFVTHKGMQTIGFLATLGIGSGLLVMFLVLPWMLEYICPKEPESA
jgi:predicted RND superfamily exporter protein